MSPWYCHSSEPRVKKALPVFLIPGALCLRTDEEQAVDRKPQAVSVGSLGLCMAASSHSSTRRRNLLCGLLAPCVSLAGTPCLPPCLRPSIVVSRWLGAGKIPQALERMQPLSGNLNNMVPGFEFTEYFLRSALRNGGNRVWHDFLSRMEEQKA